MELKTRVRFVGKYARRFIPIMIIFAIAIFALVVSKTWVNFVYKFAVVLCLFCGFLYTQYAPKAKKEAGRKVTNLLISAILVIAGGFYLKTNLQMEEFVFSLDYMLQHHVISDTIYFFVFMKLVAPFIIGRGCCGWGCWTSAILDVLPLQPNTHISRKWTYLRYPVLVLSFLLPAIWLFLGIENGLLRYTTAEGVNRVMLWFVISNLLYYVVGIGMAFLIGKKRAFCRIFCPVGLVMSFPARFSFLKLQPSGAKCISCQKCNNACPMDVEPMSYIAARKQIPTMDCIHCFSCRAVCPQGAIK